MSQTCFTSTRIAGRCRSCGTLARQVHCPKRLKSLHCERCCPCCAPRWTLQEFTTIAGRPYFALQMENDAGVQKRFTGYRHEMDALAADIGISAEQLDPIGEEEFFARGEVNA